MQKLSIVIAVVALLACQLVSASSDNVVMHGRDIDGEWLDDTLPYHVIHRIASFPDAHGIFKSILDFSFAHESNIRIDTHKDNHIMQHNILKQRFTYCGIIHLASGDERLAYQKVER